MIPATEVQALLLAAFPGADIELSDLTGTQDHYQVRIVSDAFEGKPMLQQHRLVYAALGNAMQGPIHALALQTYTPAAFAGLQGDS